MHKKNQNSNNSKYMIITPGGKQFMSVEDKIEQDIWTNELEPGENESSVDLNQEELEDKDYFEQLDY